MLGPASSHGRWQRFQEAKPNHASTVKTSAQVTFINISLTNKSHSQAQRRWGMKMHCKGRPYKVTWQRLWMFYSVARREWRSLNPISHRAHQGCLEAQVCYHGDILSEKSEISMVRACSQGLFLCYCHFDTHFSIFMLQAKIWASLIFTPRLSMSLWKLKLQDHELLSLAGSNKAENLRTQSTCNIRGHRHWRSEKQQPDWHGKRKHLGLFQVCLKLQARSSLLCIYELGSTVTFLCI